MVGLAFGLLFGAGGGPIAAADDDAGDTADGLAPGNALERGVSGANAVAGGGAIDDGRPGRTIGRSAEVNSDDTEGPTGTMYCSSRGGAFGVLGALLRTVLSLSEGAGLSIGRLFVGGTSAAVLAIAPLLSWLLYLLHRVNRICGTSSHQRASSS